MYSSFYRRLDQVSGVLICAGLIFAPWAFGGTVPWAVQIINATGHVLGVLLLLKWMIRLAVVAPSGHDGSDRGASGGWALALAIATILLLGFCGISAWNARAVYHPETWSFIYQDAIAWLPHSYEGPSSWRAFALFLALAAFFWSVRDWILHPPALHSGTAHSLAAREYPGLSRRIRLLLWILSLNGAVLAAVCIAQRIDGTGKLLWIIEPRVNKDPSTFFGPFAYRANAAQYFNLVWPVTLGLWWTCHRARRKDKSRRHHLLLSCAVLMAVAPLVSTSRGGAIVMAALVVLCAFILVLALWRGPWISKLTVVIMLGGAVFMGILLGWEELGPRMELLQEGYVQREIMFDTGRRMADDNPVYGTGPGTFSPLFQLYRRSLIEYWPAQMHNDWLETRITFGWVGLGLILTAFGLACARWFGRGGLPGERHFVWLVWCALGGCLVHARFDFPFQIPSILGLFLFLCAILSCLSRRQSFRQASS